MGLELKTNDYKIIIASLIKTSGMPFDVAFNILLNEVNTYQVEYFIELLLEEINKQNKEK